MRERYRRRAPAPVQGPRLGAVGVAIPAVALRLERTPQTYVGWLRAARAAAAEMFLLGMVAAELR